MRLLAPGITVKARAMALTPCGSRGRNQRGGDRQVGYVSY